MKEHFEREHITISEFIVSIIFAVWVGYCGHNAEIGVIGWMVVITNFRVLRLYDKG